MDGWVGTLAKGSSLGIVRIARAQLSTDWNQSKTEVLRLTRECLSLGKWQPAPFTWHTDSEDALWGLRGGC